MNEPSPFYLQKRACEAERHAERRRAARTIIILFTLGLALTAFMLIFGHK